MSSHTFLKSYAPPDASSIHRAIEDHERNGIRVSATGLKVFSPAPRIRTHEAQTGISSRRTRLWELTSMLHCSIIGTCLTTGELRALLRKSDPDFDGKASDHELHSLAVAAAARNDDVARRIQKALDNRHRITLNRFAKAQNADDVLKQWNEALTGTDIPGAYWAVLTHPRTTDELARHVFGDVHMLSHLVGAANRADIHKLRQLEEQKAALEDKLVRQQEQLREAIVRRDARIRELNDALSKRIQSDSEGAGSGTDAPSEDSALVRLIADLRKQLDSESRRRERSERKVAELGIARAADERERATMERELHELSKELAAAESGLEALTDAQDSRPIGNEKLLSRIILYVGGRPHQVARLKALVERASGQFMHHDGGIEEKDQLLAGLVSRADLAAFPVDCISHTAAQSLKRLCRQAGKPFLPLRGSGLASLLHALRSADPSQASQST